MKLVRDLLETYLTVIANTETRTRFTDCNIRQRPKLSNLIWNIGAICRNSMRESCAFLCKISFGNRGGVFWSKQNNESTRQPSNLPCKIEVACIALRLKIDGKTTTTTEQEQTRGAWDGKRCLFSSLLKGAHIAYSWSATSNDENEETTHDWGKCTALVSASTTAACEAGTHPLQRASVAHDGAFFGSVHSAPCGDMLWHSLHGQVLCI